MLNIMINSILLLFSMSVCVIAQGKEAGKEWKINLTPNDENISDAANLFIQNTASLDELSNKEKAVLKRLKDLVSGNPAKLVPKNLLKLKKVRSIQITKHGVFNYPYFNCWFKQTDEGVIFKKTSGSQHKNGSIFQDKDTTLVFLGAWSVNDDATLTYSGFKGLNDTSRDSAGLIIKRGNSFLSIFPKKENTFEIYEFK